MKETTQQRKLLTAAGTRGGAQTSTGVATSRRDFLRGAGLTLSAALAGGSAIALMACEKKAPAVKQARTIHVLQWSHWLVELDAEIMRQAEEFSAQSGVKVVIETVNLNDVVTRATVAVESRNGPDVIQMLGNHPHLFASGLADVTDAAEEMAAWHGGWDESAAAVCQVDGRYRAIPYNLTGLAMTWRMDKLAEAGISKMPDSWPEFLETGRALKRLGIPIGQSLGHTAGDAPAFCYSLLWSFGGQELADDAKTVAINSPQTVEALRYMQGLWTAGCDDAGMSWDDSSNNRAFLAGTIAGTLNGASIYFVARRDEGNYPGMADAIDHSLMPLGPAGRYHTPGPFQHGVMNYSPNQEAALDFLRFLMAKENYEKWFLAAKGYNLGPGKAWADHPMWKNDPRLLAFPKTVAYHRLPGWPGPPSQRASEVQAKYIITDMFAKAVQGDSPEAAAAWAEQELKHVYHRA